MRVQLRDVFCASEARFRCQDATYKPGRCRNMLPRCFEDMSRAYKGAVPVGPPLSPHPAPASVLPSASKRSPSGRQQVALRRPPGLPQAVSVEPSLPQDIR